MKGIICPGENMIEVGDALCFCVARDSMIHTCRKLYSGNLVENQLQAGDEVRLRGLLEARAKCP